MTATRTGRRCPGRTTTGHRPGSPRGPQVGVLTATGGPPDNPAHRAGEQRLPRDGWLEHLLHPAQRVPRLGAAPGVVAAVLDRDGIPDRPCTGRGHDAGDLLLRSELVAAPDAVGAAAAPVCRSPKPAAPFSSARVGSRDSAA